MFAVDATTEVTPQRRTLSSFRRGEAVSATVVRDRNGHLFLTRISVRASKPTQLMGEAAPGWDDPDKQAHLEAEDQGNTQAQAETGALSDGAFGQTAASIDAADATAMDPQADTVDPTYAAASTSAAPLSTCPAGNAAITGAQFVVSHQPGVAQTTVAQISGKLRQGDSISVQFSVASGCTNVSVSLVAYEAPAAAFDRTTASQQRVYQSATGNFSSGSGQNTLTVNVPPCYHDVDFVTGPPIPHLGPGTTHNFYSDQSRLIQHENGGANTCTGVQPVATATQTLTKIAPVTSPAVSRVTGAALSQQSNVGIEAASTSTTTGTPTATATSIPTSAPAGVAQADWRQHFFGPDRTAANVTASGSPPSVAMPWTAPNLAANAAVVADGKVYNTSANDTTYSAYSLHARDAITGIEASGWPQALSGPSNFAPPAVVNGVAYVSAGGMLQTFNSTTGVPGWSDDAGVENSAASDPYTCAAVSCISLAPAVAGGTVYAPLYSLSTGLTFIRALDTVDGHEKWVISGIVGETQIVVIGGRLLAWDTQSGLRAYDSSTGGILWTYQPLLGTLQITTACVVDPLTCPSGTLLVPSYHLAADAWDITADPGSNRAYVLYQEPSLNITTQISLNAVDLATGVGVLDASGKSNPVLLNSLAPAASSGAIQVRDVPIVYQGKLQLPFHAGGGSNLSAPLQLLQSDPVTLDVLSQRAVLNNGVAVVGRNTLTFVTGAHGVLYVANCAMRSSPLALGFYAIDPASANVVWGYPSTNCPEAEIAAANGLVVATDDAQLYVFSTSSTGPSLPVEPAPAGTEQNPPNPNGPGLQPDL